jgi:hypothetical protein
MRCPATIYRNRRAGDRGVCVRGQEDGNPAEFVGGGEALVRLLRQQHVADNLVRRNAVGFGLILYLGFD